MFFMISPSYCVMVQFHSPFGSFLINNRALDCIQSKYLQYMTDQGLGVSKLLIHSTPRFAPAPTSIQYSQPPHWTSLQSTLDKVLFLPSVTPVSPTGSHRATISGYYSSNYKNGIQEKNCRRSASKVPSFGTFHCKENTDLGKSINERYFSPSEVPISSVRVCCLE